MISIEMSIPQIDLKFEVCKILSSKKDIEEIKQAFECERYYNHSELDWTGFIYERNSK